MWAESTTRAAFRCFLVVDLHVLSSIFFCFALNFCLVIKLAKHFLHVLQLELLGVWQWGQGLCFGFVIV